MKTKALLSLILVPCFVLATTLSASATDQQDISVALKTLPLLTNKISNPATVAIVYDSTSVQSKIDAEAIKGMFDDGLEAPNDVKLIPSMVNMMELSKLQNAQLAILAHGIPPADYNSIGNAAAAAGILTICTDLEGVSANACVLGVVSKPQVKVFYNPIAADKAKISFVSAFTMLAKQVGTQ